MPYELCVFKNNIFRRSHFNANKRNRVVSRATQMKIRRFTVYGLLGRSEPVTGDLNDDLNILTGRNGVNDSA